MKTLILSILIIILSSCSNSDQKIDQYCQDLNVLFIKEAVIKSNLANIETTRTVEGGPYQRQVVSSCQKGFCQISLDKREPMLKYAPHHPDANKQGYVPYPNMNLSEEKEEYDKWLRVFEQVQAAAPVEKDFFLNNPKAENCFNKYPLVNEKLNFKKYLSR